MTHRAVAAAGLLACAFLAREPALAQNAGGLAPRVAPSGDAALEARTSAVAATLRCPVCQGESIQDSPAALAQQMRAVVRERLRSGETPDQVRAYFVSRYGEWILLEPEMTGLNVVLYVLPVVLVLGGLVFVVVLVRRWTTPVDQRVNPPAAVDTTERAHGAR